MGRADSFEKTLMLGKIEGGRRRGWQRMRLWMASLTQRTWVWVNSRSCWWTGRPGMLQFMGLQRVGHNWATELNWTELVFLNKVVLKHNHIFLCLFMICGCFCAMMRVGKFSQRLYGPLPKTIYWLLVESHIFVFGTCLNKEKRKEEKRINSLMQIPIMEQMLCKEDTCWHGNKKCV